MSASIPDLASTAASPSRPIDGRGKEGVRQFFEKVYAASGETIAFVPIEVLANDDHLVLFLRFTAHRGDESLDMTLAGFHSDNSPQGWRRATFLPSDQTVFDHFFAN